MTEDLLQNVSQPGRNHSFPSHRTLALDGNKEELKNLEVWKGDSIGGVKHEKRVFGQDETKMRPCYDPSRDLARGVKSEAGEKDAQMGASPHVLAQFGQRDLFRGLKCRPEEMSNLQLQDPCEIYEPGGRGEGDELGDSKKGEAKISAVCKSQETAASRQLRQSPQGCHQYLQQGASGGLHSFLPQKNLRILLVEDDDSTRHVVSALLRNCGYEVTSVESTVQAWEALQDRSCHFDLALTEIMLPSLAGIGLLAKMKNQESCKQIPVVMMSSLDSMDIVFKCLSKGAVDFLVKPVRKNELNNLWQHVWRKCQSSSGSGSGSESQTGKVAGMKDINDMTNNSESNGNEGNSLNLGGDSDNGSGTQSFWTKRGVEVDSTHRPAEWDVTHHPPGTLAHADACKNSPVPPEDSSLSVDAARVKSQPKDTEHVIGKNLEIAARKIGALEIQVAKSGHLKDADQSVHIMPMQDVEQCKPPIDKGIQDVSERVVSGTKVVTLLANIGCQSKNKENPHRSKDGEMLDRGASNSFDTKDNISGPRLLPALELTLKRSSTSAEHDKVESRHVLRQSGISAFSRYSNSRGALQQHPLCSVGSFTLTSFPLQGSEVSTLLSLNAQISSGYNNQEMTPSMIGSSGQGGLVQAAKEEAAFASGVPMSIALPSSAMVSFNGASVFSPSRHPVFYTHSSKFPWAVAAHLTDQDGHAYQNFEDYDFPLQQVYHHHSHHHHHHHVQRHHHLDAHKDPGSPKSSEEEQTVTDLGSGPPLCGSSNTIQIVSSNHNVSGSSNGYGVNGNGSVNGSTSGSINRNGNSNGQSGVMANAGLIGESGNNNGNSASGIGHGISSVNGGNGSMAVVGPEQYCFTRRDAALNKFRQKRKERCFDKKVRYQSRKRLAEQRPRVRGQFVRQVAKFPADPDKEHGKVEYTFADTNVDFVDAEHDISQCRPS